MMSKIQEKEDIPPDQQQLILADIPDGPEVVDPKVVDPRHDTRNASRSEGGHTSQPTRGGGYNSQNAEGRRPSEIGPPSTPPGSSGAGADKPIPKDSPLRTWLSNFHWAQLLKKKWSIPSSIVILLSSITLAAIIALAVIYARLKKSQPPSLTIMTPPADDVLPLPIVDAGLGAAAIVLGSFFLPTKHHIKVVYDGGGKLCVRREDSSWESSVQCVEGADPKKNSPLTMLDWIGGPSIFFISSHNFLSSIDIAYTNDTMKLTNLIDSKVKVHEQSQLASVAFLNGTSGWVHFQSQDANLQEYGKYDYRDVSWSGGSTGDIGRCRIGTGIAAVRWLEGENEVEELYCEADSGVLQGRVFANSAWNREPYSVDLTLGNVTAGSSLGATTVKQGNNSAVLLAYVSSSGFLTVQTRRTTNLSSSDYHAFSTPTQLVQGDGRARAGLAAISWLDQVRLYLINKTKILELSSSNASTANWTASTANWTTTTVPF
ncbi:hypothetical protein GP486_000739 [Trichoglossum hirsutum]|uniref:Fucose-specific lectin n=1 Tax=Trichoglossum hirsutum TaxID=265104 RepID=A0A9P8RTC9_9PEZI|nr:hypothetical protein GP486_000739 [Trichoglossum hirsutum]